MFDFNLCLNADRFVEVDDALIPTGHYPSVRGTPYDLRTPRRIGSKPDGYDTCFLLNRQTGEGLTHAATLTGGGLSLSVYTNSPCLQVYTACVLEGEPAFRGGIRKARQTAVCLEAQELPNGPNLGAGILQAGELYSRTTVYRIESVQ